MILFFVLVFPVHGKDYTIYAITQDVPMGESKEVIKKNFYLDIGKHQGVDTGTKLDVYRTLSRYNPFDSNKQFQFKIKVGMIRVIHSEENSSIAESVEFYNSTSLQLDIPSFMIGDKIQVDVDS
jgi:hypothetical protein